MHRCAGAAARQGSGGGEAVGARAGLTAPHEARSLGAAVWQRAHPAHLALGHRHVDLALQHPRSLQEQPLLACVVVW